MQRLFDDWDEPSRKYFTKRSFEGLVKTTYTRLAVHEGLVGANGFRDLSDVFQAVTASVFIDFAHKSEGGNELVAEEIVRDLMRVLDASPASVGGVTNATR